MSRKFLILLGLPLLIAACEGSPAAPATVLSAEDAPLLSHGANAGLVRTTWPSAEDPGPPYYARIDYMPPHVITVDGWAVIPFYRDPACIPPDLNLRELFDLVEVKVQPDVWVPRVFLCPLAVEGSSLWHGAVGAGSPKVVQSQGTGAVPFWFIPVGAVLNAMQDGVLTIGELAALDPLVGYATHFNEVLHPAPLPFPGGGGHPVGKLVMNAQGRLEDSRRFQFQRTLVQGPGEVSIRLRFW